jgi:hypothetical protein
MATNLSIESPNFEKIAKESGQFTADAINLLWSALNDTRAVERRDFRAATERFEPLVLTLQPSSAVNNLDLAGASVVSFTGSSAQNFSGMRAPETNKTRLVFIEVSGSATITVKHQLTSETNNQFSLSTAADFAMTTGKGLVVAYLASRWRELARSG